MPVIRRGRPADLASLLVLVREFNQVDGHDHDDDRVTRALGPLLHDDAHGQVWLIDAPGASGDDLTGDAEPAGYAVLCWGYSLESGGREAVLDEIFVRDRGRGLGTVALPELLDACRAAGVLRVFLETEKPNERARHFYRRHGFQEESSIWMTRDL